MRFTLDELALYNRCLYSDDFKKDLLRVGATEETARMLSNFVRDNPKAGILGVYQEFIGDEKIAALLDKAVREFIV